MIRSLAIAAFWLLPLGHATLYGFCTVMGFIWLGTMPLTNGVPTHIFGMRYLATLFGFMFFGHQLGAFLGVWLGGMVFDSTKSYNLVWQLCIVTGFVSAALHYPIRDAEIRRPVLAGAAA